MTQGDRERLRSTFDQAAELYDRVRPRYPPALFDDLAELTGIGPGSRVLEIGPGTGQATIPLAERGCQVVAVELGAHLAAVARRNLARFPAVEVVTAAFEAWPLPSEPFDLVLAATAFHWIDPAVRVDKAADALRPGGWLATIATHHVAGGDESFFAEAQDCYICWDPATPPTASRCPPRRTFPAPARSSTAPAGSAPPSSAATSGTSRTPPPATGSCCSPTPATATWSPRPRPVCSTASAA
jgi:SAM-dependent methyltransferase